MGTKLFIKDLDLKDKKVLMRVDFNVPMNKGIISDDSRILAALPSIRYALDQGASLVLMSHLGRPKGKISPELSLAPCASYLSKILHKPVQMSPDCIGPTVQKLVKELKPGQILLLENLRFHNGEEHPEEHPDFAAQLAKLGDVYINEAFSNAHRAHSSSSTITRYFPGKAAAGIHLKAESDFLSKTLLNPTRPFYALIGGSKASSKLGIIRALIKKADAILIGGGMAFTFLKAKGYKIGSSLCEENLIKTAKEIIEECCVAQVPLMLPEDSVVADKLQDNAHTYIATTEAGIQEEAYGVDIGPKTIATYKHALETASTIFWNGPLGIFEMPRFSVGTYEIAKALANLTKEKKITTIVGGGDSLSAIKKLNLTDSFSHLSTGGGATLEYIEYGSLPALEALSEKK